MAFWILSRGEKTGVVQVSTGNRGVASVSVRIEPCAPSVVLSGVPASRRDAPGTITASAPASPVVGVIVVGVGGLAVIGGVQ